MISLARKVHRWLALLVSFQILIWIVTGFLFGLIDGDRASGKLTRDRNAEQALIIATYAIEPAKLIDINQHLVLKSPNTAIEKISLVSFAGEWFYQLHQDNNIIRVNAYTGELFSVDKNLAKELANNSYNGSGTQIHIERLAVTQKKEELGHWQVTYNDAENTRVIISSTTGKVMKHLNDYSDYHQLLKTLHFMDYRGTGHFNDWWIILLSSISLLLSISGTIWLVDLFKRSVKRRRKKLTLSR